MVTHTVYTLIMQPEQIVVHFSTESSFFTLYQPPPVANNSPFNCYTEWISSFFIRQGSTKTRVKAKQTKRDTKEQGKTH